MLVSYPIDDLYILFVLLFIGFTCKLTTKWSAILLMKMRVGLLW